MVVTGGTSGIGAATSRRFLEEGARVVSIALAGEATTINVADGASVSAAVDVAVKKFGRLDVIVNAAGVIKRQASLEMSAEEFRRIVDVNLTGAFLCAQAAARRMVAGGGGAILMTASTNGLVAHPLYAAYNASKAGVIALARTMALELAPTVRVNAVCPGYVLTPMQEAEYTPEMLREVDARIPLGRHARPEEVAALFAFLASDDGAYLTGAVIPVDGGETA